jgi:F420H(2)-dependent quinone reductase
LIIMGWGWVVREVICGLLGAVVAAGRGWLVGGRWSDRAGARNNPLAKRVIGCMPLSGQYEPSPSTWSRDQAELYEASGGTEGLTLRGRPVVVVTSVGARTGKLRKTPLMRVEHDGSYAVIASHGGTPKHPVWYYNLIASPLVELQDGPVKHDYLAREVFGEERALWWARAVETWPDYATYQTRTSRVIPVFVLTRKDA